VIIAVVAFSLARYLPDLRGLAGLAVVVLGLAVDYGTVDQRVHNWSDVVFIAALITPPYVLGRLTRRLAEQGAQLVHQQELVKREAVRAERDRIARELHDVIAHSVSAMVVQTAAAQDLLHTDPDGASEALEDVATTGRRALAETGRLLHVIRDDANELGLEPAPGLARLPELVEGFRGSGLTVDVKLDGPVTPLPQGVDLSAYRIVQEALTNALKYSADRTASLRLTRSPRQLTIHAENAPRHGDVRSNGGGLGLVGMAERVSVFGGRLSHGLNGDGRYVLTATLPVSGGGEHA